MTKKIPTSKEVTTTSAQEYENLKGLCQAHDEKFNYRVVNGLILVTASITFLTTIGY